MKQIIAEAQKNTNDSTKIQLPAPIENNNIHNSPVSDLVPNENAVNKIAAKKTSETRARSVTPIHDPEKPSAKKPDSRERKTVIRHPSSNEKPNPTPAKKAAVKKETPIKKVETRIPKAVMPPKSDY
jgi:hypothetical protein